jgi:parvulin-like peptidyl-prolyl isomerase
VQRSAHRTIVAGVLGVALVVALGAFVISGDIGEPDVPEGDVAIVEDAPDGGITEEEFQTDLEQAAFNLQLDDVPPPEDPQYEQVSQAAISNAIQTRWVKGEAEERGITVDDRDIDQALDSIINDQLGGQKGYQQFLKDSPFDEEAVRDVAELTAISDRLQEDAIPQADSPDVSDSEVQDYYDTHIEQFQTPETRDVRVILNPDEAKVQAAMDELGSDPTPEDWKRVAKKYSTDDATKNDGGLRQDVAQGQNEPALDEAIFSASEGEVVGPITGDSGSYVIQVEQITPASTSPLDEVSDQIRQTLQQGIQSQQVESFRADFIEKWTSRTFCTEDVMVDLCGNAPPAPDACTVDDDSEREQADPTALEAGCPAPVPPRSVVNPGTGQVFPGEPIPALPQGPIKQQPEAAPTGLPPGATPIGPGGAPVPPTGTAPPSG